MRVKTSVHVAVFFAGLVEVEVDTEEGLDIQATVKQCSAPSLHGVTMPSVKVRRDGSEETIDLAERITQAAGHLLTQEVEAVIRHRIESTGAELTEGQLLAPEKGMKQ